MKLFRRAKHFFAHNFIWLGISSIAWLLFRSGTKPSRLRYPCQQAAMSTSSLFLGTFALPGLSRGLKRFWPGMPSFRLRRSWVAIATVLIVALVAGVFVHGLRANRVMPVQTPPAVSSVLPAWRSDFPDPSHIFVVDSFPVPDTTILYHEGLDSLLSLLASNGIHLYKSTKPLPWCDTNGLIGKNDVVLLKVNAEWDQRGQTNGDLIKGLIARIVAHPDTFTGEVDLVENGQWRCSFEYAQNNAENQAQTMKSVVDRFAGMGYHVGLFDWTLIGYGTNNHWVNEYDQGDTVSGYVREDSSGMTYAKFKTSYGTLVSVRKGVWNGSQYEPDRLKFINMPVLKSHSLMGVSASTKHYIGFLDYSAIGPNNMHQRAMTQGLLGVDFGKARFPDLNIIDATWVMAEIDSGPNAPYSLATRQDILVASKDPIANDYYAGKYVIRPISWWYGHAWLHNYGRMDPDNLNTENPGSNHRYSVDSTPCSGMPYNAFHQLLVSNRDKMLAYGKHVTMDTLQMTVHLFSFRNPTGVNESGSRPLGLTVDAIPNPGSGSTAIRYSLARSGPVRIAVFDPAGRLVVRFPDRSQTAGQYTVNWNRRDAAGARVAAGNYLVKVESGELTGTVRIVLTGD
jgi:hypothetical protein